MSDIPIVPGQSGTSQQDGHSQQADLEMVQKAIGRRRMEAVLVQGHAHSWVDRRRIGPASVAGLLTTGLIASGIAITVASQDRNDTDVAQPEPAPLRLELPSFAPPSSTPARSTTKPSTAAPRQVTPALRQVNTTEKPSTTDRPDSQQRPTSKPKRPTHVQLDKPDSDKPTTDRPTTQSTDTGPKDTKSKETKSKDTGPKHRGPKAKHQGATPNPHSAKPKHHGSKHKHHGSKPKHKGDGKAKHVADRRH